MNAIGHSSFFARMRRLKRKGPKDHRRIHVRGVIRLHTRPPLAAQISIPRTVIEASRYPHNRLRPESCDPMLHAPIFVNQETSREWYPQITVMTVRIGELKDIRAPTIEPRVRDRPVRSCLCPFSAEQQGAHLTHKVYRIRKQQWLLRLHLPLQVPMPCRPTLPQQASVPVVFPAACRSSMEAARAGMNRRKKHPSETAERESAPSPPPACRADN